MALHTLEEVRFWLRSGGRVVLIFGFGLWLLRSSAGFYWTGTAAFGEKLFRRLLGLQVIGKINFSVGLDQYCS